MSVRELTICFVTSFLFCGKKEKNIKTSIKKRLADGTSRSNILYNAI